MKRPTLALAALVLAALFAQACSLTPDWAGPGRARPQAEEEGEGPADLLLARDLLGSDIAPHQALPAALEDTESLAAETQAIDPELAALQWEMVGPTNIGGRILDVAIDPVLADTIYVAAASGGVWVSSDTATEEGFTFQSVWPDHLPQAIGALTISPSGVLYAGTGESGPGGGSFTYGGNGVYRSADRGETWEHIGLAGTSRISRIVLDPKNEQRVFVAATGPLYTPGGQRGIFLSQNGGETWDKVLAGDNGTTGGTDVAINPQDTNVVYAAMWDHLRTPDQRRYNGLGSGLYKSLDGGKTWARILTGGFGPGPHIGRIGVAVAPSAPNTVYATVAGESGLNLGFYKSTDAGLTWTVTTSPSTSVDGHFVYGWWFGRVWVDPDDANRVWHAGVVLGRSTNGGQTWTSLGSVHADQHAMAWDPKVPNRVYLGNDGGTYRSDDDGNTWIKATYEPYSQLYTIDVSQQDPQRQVAGLQDNGVNRSYRSNGTAGSDQWSSYHGGDGLRASINPVNQQIVYGCSQYGECSVSTNGGNTNSAFTNEVISSRKNWLTPIEMDPANPSIVYTGGEIMSRSLDNAGNWSVISGELSNGPGRETNPLFKNYGTLTTISPAAGSSTATGTIYAGTDDGNLWYTHTGGATWIKAADPDLPKAWITRVEVDPTDKNVAYVAYSGMRQGDDAAYILRTSDGGANWHDITGDLPKAPINDVNVIGGSVFVASDFGVFLTRDLGRTWLKVGSNLPLAPIHELRYQAATNSLYVATFGRSAWRVTLPA
jgi:photosystem II stability/assembly factor-like uncharacterized protein